MEIYVLFILIPLSILNILFDIHTALLIINVILLLVSIGVSFYCSIFKKVVGASFLYYYVHFGVIEFLYSLIGNVLLYNGGEEIIKWIILVVQLIDLNLKVIFLKMSEGRIY